MYCRYWRVCDWRVLSGWVWLLQQHRGRFHLHLLQRVLLFPSRQRMYRYVTYTYTHSTTLERRGLLKCTKNDKWSMNRICLESHRVDYVVPGFSMALGLPTHTQQGCFFTHVFLTVYYISARLKRALAAVKRVAWCVTLVKNFTTFRLILLQCCKSRCAATHNINIRD